jgi:nitroreductase
MFMKKRMVLLAAAALVFALAFSAAADVALPPPPGEGGMGIFEALKRRASAPRGDFPAGPLTDSDLSCLLWAATGLNRGEKGWTVPMDKGVPPYVAVYAANADGVFRYDWASHSLVEAAKRDIRPDIGMQNFVAGAPCSLIFVADSEALSEFKDPVLQTQFADVAAGAMTQNVYLAAAALKIGARYIHSLKADVIKEALGLKDEDRVICLMLWGQ